MTSLSRRQLPISLVLQQACLPGGAPPHADLVLQCQHDQVSVLRSIRGCSARRRRSISVDPSDVRTHDVDNCQRSLTARLEFGSCTGKAVADGRVWTTTRLSLRGKCRLVLRYDRRRQGVSIDCERCIYRAILRTGLSFTPLRHTGAMPGFRTAHTPSTSLTRQRLGREEVVYWVWYIVGRGGHLLVFNQPVAVTLLRRSSYFARAFSLSSTSFATIFSKMANSPLLPSSK